jgi:CubicO group peptidase (beta-lactamase class C family)
MVLGEILYRATDQDLQTYADINLFSKIGMEAYWWRDFDESAQVNGNYLAYCCIDATPRDFAKFGQLLLNNGVWDGQQIIPVSYIEKIKNIINDSVVTENGGHFSYGLKFWTVFPQSLGNNVVYPPANKLYATKGFDGQYIVIDYDNNMIVVRNSIYTPALNLNDQRRMKVNASDLANTNFTATLPAGISMATQTDFNLAALLYGVKESINP